MAENQTLSLNGPIYLASFLLTDLLACRRTTIDVDAVHKAVMSLFPDVLPGVDGRRRESAGILYRLDDGPRGKMVIVQSHVPAVGTTPSMRVRPVMGGVPAFDAGQAVRFRTTVNAVRKERSRIIGAVPKDEMGAWLARRTGIDGLEVIGHTRDIVKVSRKDAHGFPIVVDTVEGVGSIADPVVLAGAMRHGIGHSRAFGCGLLTVVPIQVG
ncbi:MAG: type I-E CRISPR-associated protein Cas6/Cse3/CasE [Micrococcales bacterium]|nr:type I-E CRISPR-associated protein Cas6/Cse3/CasE [Micrococcales bacterium]